MKTPGEELVELLNKLRQRLNNSGVERTVGLRDVMGDDCTYFRRSMDKFIRKDYQDVHEIIGKLMDVYRVLEGR